MRWFSGLALALVVVIGASGCGSGGSSTTKSESSTSATAPTDATEESPSFAGCKSSKESYELGKEIIAEGQKAVNTGKEVKAAEANVRIGEKMVRQSIEGCATEAELKANEAKICANTPQELAEALEVEDTRGNEEYIGVYEATCGKHVPTR
jgi:hypothetical protein